MTEDFYSSYRQPNSLFCGLLRWADLTIALQGLVFFWEVLALCLQLAKGFTLLRGIRLTHLYTWKQISYRVVCYSRKTKTSHKALNLRLNCTGVFSAYISYCESLIRDVSQSRKYRKHFPTVLAKYEWDGPLCTGCLFADGNSMKSAGASFVESSFEVQSLSPNYSWPKRRIIEGEECLLHPSLTQCLSFLSGTL